eukprot:200486_1
MGAAFGKRKTIKEIIREQKRMVDRSIRQLDRERKKQEMEEKKLIQEMKKLAEKNQLKSVRIMAKDLVRIRKSQEKFVGLVAHLRGLSLKMQENASVAALTESMRNCTKSMYALNKTMNLPQLQKIMMEFEKQSEQLDMKQEVMGDALDDALGDEEDEEEENEALQKICDEIGIGLNEQLIDAPQNKQKAEEKEVVSEDAELEARLRNLQR